MPQFLDLSYYKSNFENFAAILYPIKTVKLDYKEGDIYDRTIKLATSDYGLMIYNYFKLEEDNNTLLDLALEHGTFLEKFYERKLSIRVKKKLLENRVDLKSIQKEYCKFNHCQLTDQISKFLPQNIALDFYRVSLYNNNNDTIYSIVKEWYYENAKTRECEICKNEFRPINLPNWVYYGANGNLSICYECPVTEETEKEISIKFIKKFVELCGFIPNSDFSPINHNFSSKVKPTNWTPLMEVFFKIGDIKSLHGSWFKALVEAGVLKGNVLATSRGVKCIAKSGNECNSLDEQHVDNWFYDNNFETLKEPVYPKHEKYNASGRRRADWLVNGYYVEYFGLSGDTKYDKKTLEKLNLVQELNLKLIALFPEDLHSLDTKLSILKK